MGICKKKRTLSDEELTSEYGETWIWTAIDSTTRLLICSVIGERILENARKIVREIKDRSDGTIPLFFSDELPHYADGILKQFSTTITPEPSGMPGRPQGTYNEIDPLVDYATVHKTRENGRIIKVEKKIIFGDWGRILKKFVATPSATVNTSYVERTNTDWRLWDAHLTRKSLTYAKSIRWLEAKFNLVVAFYNFIRSHETLSRDKHTRLFTPRTPAMAAGVTNHPWSINELLNFQT